MSVTKGHTFGTTEQVNSTKLHNLVDLATLSVVHSELAANMLSSLATSAGRIPSFMLIPSLASGATIRYDGNRGFYGV